MHISFPEIQISRFEQLQILYFISFYTFKMKSISINRGGYFFILFILVASGIWKAESYSVKRRHAKIVIKKIHGTIEIFHYFLINQGSR